MQDSHFSSPQEEIASIDETVSSLDAEIRNLQSKRGRLLYRRNQLLTPACSLAPELLATIFETYYKKFTEQQTPEGHMYCVLKLGAICSYWRQVAWSMPSLWTDITIDLSSTTLRNVVDRLSLHYQNSFNLLVSVRFLHPEIRATATPDFAEGVIPLVLRDQAARLGSLSLEPFCDSWLKYILSHLNTSTFPHLHSLQLAHRDLTRLGKHSFALKCPQLREVTLSVHQGNTILNLPWSQLTVLRLKWAPFLESFNILAQNPQLEEFRYFDVWGDSHTEPGNHIDLITLDNLKVFEWSSSLGVSLITRLRLPSLHQLTLGKIDFDDTNQWKQFFLHIKNLEAFCIRFEPPSITNILALVPSIRILRLQAGSLSKITTTFEYLTAYKDQNLKLPLLRSFTWSYEWPHHHVIKYALEMVNSRWEVENGDKDKSRLEVFHLHRLMKTPHTEWAQGDTDRLKDLVQQGMDIQISEYLDEHSDDTVTFFEEIPKRSKRSFTFS